MRRTPVILVPVLAGIFIASVALGKDNADPRAWLDRMTSAMSQMTYQGSFVYLTGGSMQSMRITHVSDEDGVRERLSALSGPAREIIRDSNGVKWVLGDSQSVFADSNFNPSFFPELPLDQSSQVAESYILKFGGKNRIAGHQAINIKILPRDNYRYGYSLWLEVHSGLLLAWELLDSRRHSLAKLMFTDLLIGSEVDPGELKPSGHMKKYKTVGPSLPAGRSGADSQPLWQPSRLPSGFELTVHRLHGVEDSSTGVFEHQVYSDGLAAVSVYVESVVVPEGFKSGINRHGTTHAYSRHTEGALITVVGDVPALTVELIGKSVDRISH